MGIVRAVRNALAASILAISPVVAQETNGPVVVELYTSQGCSSCPPADRLMHELAAREDVIALALHVDYWDYIGWKDSFADPAHADRQRAYARKAGKRMVYTPQMIIDGTAHVVGNKPMQVADLIARHNANPNPVSVTLRREGARISIRAAGDVRGAMDVHLVQFDREETVRITRGENRGETLSYANIVRDWSRLRGWTGGAPLEMTVEVSGDLPVAVLVQRADHGPILGAAALR